MNQTTIFDIMYPKYKITKPIRLIELFAGYGSQYLALKYLGANVKHYKICEWAAKSIQAYNDLHIQDYFDYSGNLSDDNILTFLIGLGVSINYNEPATREQLKRQNFRRIYNNIIATNNLVNIQNAKGEDFKIVDKNKYDYIMTYSFPCQDLSLAGKRAGMKDISTRSGMLWEVERILNELKKTNSLPQILLMENVPQVHGTGNVEYFNKWQLALEKLGYKSYFQDLIATDYGIPQTRNRTFMVSILGDYNYTFPKPIPLKLKLKDMLEDNVDEKYYLSDKMINCFLSESKDSKFPRKERFFQTLKTTNEDGITATLCTTGGTRCTDNFITNKSLRETLEQNEIDDTCYIDTYNRKINKDKSGTITTGVSFRNNTFLAIKKDTENYIEWEEKGKIDMNCRAWKDKVGTLNTGGETKILIKNATKQGYLEATDGDGIDISSRMEYHRGTVQKGKTQTLTTSGGNDRGVVSGLRIRKLTPKECFRLMGVKDEDYENVAKNQSNSSLYHLAGDSIVVNVLMAIFKELIK